MSAMHKSSKRNRMSARMRRDVFNYRYLKRNLLIAALVVAMTALITVVVKYGEALDQKAGYNVGNPSTEDTVSVTEDTTENIAAADTEQKASAQMEAHHSDVLSEARQESEFDGRFIVQISDTLNIRESASTDAAIVGKMFDGTVGDILGTEGEWTQISSGNVTGYVKTEYILTGKAAEAYAAGCKKLIGTITDETVRLRSDMSTESDVLDLIAEGTKLDVLSDGAEWVKVVTAGGQEGYVAADYISVEETYRVALSIEEYNAVYDAPEEEEPASSDEEAAENQTTESQTTETPDDGRQEEPSTEGSTAPEPEPSVTVDASGYGDAYLLACLVSMEAGSECYEGQLAVANVVLNRVRSGAWGSSISDVIYAPNQFPCATGSVMQGYLQNGPLSTAQQAANDALAGNNNIGNYMSFLNVNYIDTDSLSSYQIIGNHCFY